MSQPSAARRPRSRSARVPSVIGGAARRLLAQTGRALRILLTALMCGVLPPPNIEDPPPRTRVTQVEKKRS